jgi:hypothetical protein
VPYLMLANSLARDPWRVIGRCEYDIFFGFAVLPHIDNSTACYRRYQPTVTAAPIPVFSDLPPAGMIGKSHVIARNAQHFDALRWIAHLFRGTQALLCFLSVVVHVSVPSTKC